MNPNQPGTFWQGLSDQFYSIVNRLFTSQPPTAPRSFTYRFCLETILRFSPQLLIIVVIVIAYIPSIHQPARADQIAVLAELSTITDLPTILSQSFALNRHRVFNPGDELLFRPILDLTLGLETWAFRYNFIWWQLVGIALHITVALSLLQLLTCLYRSFLAPTLTLYFATLYIAAEAVMWHHIHGYLIFAICLLQAFRHLAEYTVYARHSTRVVAGLFLWTSAASFSHELGAIFSIFAALSTFIVSRRVHALDGISTARLAPRWWHHIVTIAPLFIYITSSVSHFKLSGAHLPVDPVPLSMDSTSVVTNSMLAQLWWLLLGLLPTSLSLEAGSRVVVAPADTWRFLNPTYWSMVHYGNLIACMFILATAVTAGIVSVWRHRAIRFLLIVCVAFALAQSHAASIVLTRVSGRSLGFALGNAVYYSYLFWLLLIVGFHASRPTCRRPFAAVALGLMILIAVCNMMYVRRLGFDMTIGFSDQIFFIDRVSSLQRVFTPATFNSLYIEPGIPGNPELPWLFNRLAPSRQWTVINALFPQLRIERLDAEIGIVRESFPRIVWLGSSASEAWPVENNDAP